MKRIKMIFKVIVVAISLYLGVGYLLHLSIFPEQIPQISTYFQPGDVIKSDAEGFVQTVTRQEGGKVYCRITLEPHAEGPPKHIHTEFDELFENGAQEMTMLVGDDVVTLKPYETYNIPKGTPHKPYNPTAKPIDLTMDKFAFPEEFAFFLNQVYGYMDESPENMKPPKIILQMAMFNQHFDSYLAEHAPPVVIQKITNFLLVPMARLLGYQSYYEKYDVNRG